MRTHTGPITTLREAMGACRLLWVFCMQCGHATHLHPWSAATKLGSDAHLKQVAAHCRCTRCKALDSVVFPSRRGFEKPR